MPTDICDDPGQIGTGTCDSTYTGFRLPLIVISPLSQKFCLSSGTRLHGSAEAARNSLQPPPLTQRDAVQIDRSEFLIV